MWKALVSWFAINTVLVHMERYLWCDKECVDFYRISSPIPFSIYFILKSLRIFLRPCEISSSHGGEYKAQSLLGCTAVLLN
jgi:hypothetical protein